MPGVDPMVSITVPVQKWRPFRSNRYVAAPQSCYLWGHTISPCNVIVIVSRSKRMH